MVFLHQYNMCGRHGYTRVCAIVVVVCFMIGLQIQCAAAESSSGSLPAGCSMDGTVLESCTGATGATLTLSYLGITALKNASVFDGIEATTM